MCDDVFGQTSVHDSRGPADGTEPFHGQEHVSSGRPEGDPDDDIGHAPVPKLYEPVFHAAAGAPVSLDTIVSERSQTPQMPVGSRGILSPLEKRHRDPGVL